MSDIWKKAEEVQSRRTKMQTELANLFFKYDRTKMEIMRSFGNDRKVASLLQELVMETMEKHNKICSLIKD